TPARVAASWCVAPPASATIRAASAPSLAFRGASWRVRSAIAADHPHGGVPAHPSHRGQRPVRQSSQSAHVPHFRWTLGGLSARGGGSACAAVAPSNNPAHSSADGASVPVVPLVSREPSTIKLIVEGSPSPLWDVLVGAS